jgi:cell fate regulator YaaT (PSP1 superfamily)
MGLELKIFRGELNPSGSKLTLYFSAEQKVDTRPLLRDLGAELQIRVELRQTGVRDEAKMVGGIGSCGRELCCTTWLPAFVPVSIKNAKDQGLVLNPTKVSGQCGRLKCCLVYEQETYAELRKGLPKLGKRVIAGGDSEGRVVEVDVLRRRIRVNHGDGRFEVYEADQVEPMFPSQKPNAPRGDRAPDKSDSPSRPSQSKKKRRQSKKKRSDPPSD